MEYTFVYGTLKDTKVQKKIVGRVVEGESDVLDGYSKSKIMINGEEYPIAVKNKLGFIEGKLLKVTSNELRAIDEYETKDYKRMKVRLKSGKSAWVYFKSS